MFSNKCEIVEQSALSEVEERSLIKWTQNCRAHGLAYCKIVKTLSLSKVAECLVILVGSLIVGVNEKKLEAIGFIKLLTVRLSLSIKLILKGLIMYQYICYHIYLTISMLHTPYNPPQFHWFSPYTPPTFILVASYFSVQGITSRLPT